MGGAAKSGVPGQIAWAIDDSIIAHDYPGGFVYVPAGSSVKIVAGFGQVQSGSLNITIKDNGVAIPGLTGITVGTGAALHSMTAYNVGANHLLTLSVNSGTGVGLSFSAYTVTG